MRNKVLWWVAAPWCLPPDWCASAGLRGIHYPRAQVFQIQSPDGDGEPFRAYEDEGKLFYYSNGAAETTFKVAKEGDYEIVVKASCDSALNERAKYKLLIDGKRLARNLADCG